MSEDSYIKIPTEIVKNHNISNLEFRVLSNIIFLSSYNNGHSFLGSFKLSDMCGIGRAALRKALINLENLHLITINQRGNYSRSNDILLTLQDGLKFLRNGGSAEAPQVDLKDSPEVDLKDSPEVDLKDPPVDLKEPPYKNINLNNINLNNNTAEVDLKEPPKRGQGEEKKTATGDVAPVRSMPMQGSAKEAEAESQCELEDYILADGFFKAFPDFQGWTAIENNQIMPIANTSFIIKNFNRIFDENRAEIDKFFAEKKQKISVFCEKTSKKRKIIVNSLVKTAI